MTEHDWGVMIHGINEEYRNSMFDEAAKVTQENRYDDAHRLLEGKVEQSVPKMEFDALCDNHGITGGPRETAWEAIKKELLAKMEEQLAQETIAFSNKMVYEFSKEHGCALADLMQFEAKDNKKRKST